MSTDTGAVLGRGYPAVPVIPSLGATAVTVSAMRAAATLIETAAVTGVSVTCDDSLISIQVCRHQLPGLAARLQVLSALADVLGSRVLREDAAGRPTSWLRVSGSAAGIAVRVFAELQISVQDEGEALALGPDGDLATRDPQTHPPDPLPPGWRWVTELDQLHLRDNGEAVNDHDRQDRS